MSQLPASPIRMLILSDSAQDAEIIAGLLQTEPGFTVATSRAAYGEAARSARQGEPDIILLLTDTLTGTDPLVAVEDTETAAPGAAVVVLSADNRYTPRDFILAGARDCLAPPYDREVLASNLRQIYMHERRRRDRLAMSLGLGQRQHRCRVVAVHGAKGGVGATTVAINIAVALKKLTDERVAIADVSLQTGDVGVSLNLVGSAALDDLLPHINDLDADLLNRVLVTHSSGVQVLLAPRDLERADSIGTDEVRRILTSLSSQFDYVVLDTASVLDQACLGALDYADKIVLLTTPEIPALKNTGRFLQLTKRLGYPAEKVLLVVNRVGGGPSIPLPQIERSLGWKPAATIPAALGLFGQATNRGEALVAVSPWRGPSRSLFAIAKALAISTKAPKRRGLLGGLSSLLPGRRPKSGTPASPAQPAAARTS